MSQRKAEWGLEFDPHRSAETEHGVKFKFSCNLSRSTDFNVIPHQLMDALYLHTEHRSPTQEPSQAEDETPEESQNANK